MLDAPNTQTLQGQRDRALLQIFFYVGARCSELAKLKLEDFSYDNEFVPPPLESRDLLPLESVSMS